MERNRQLFFYLLLIGTASTTWPQTPGRVTGVVQDSTGKALSGVYVSILVRPPSTHSYEASARTGNDGSYTFAGVPPGTYELCAIPGLGTDFINPCLGRSFSAPRNLIQVEAGKTAAPSKPLILAKGVRVQFRFNDTGSLLQQHDNASKSELSVQTSALPGVGYTQPALVAEGPTFRVYETIAPAGQPLTISIRSQKLEIADSTNQKMPTQGAGAPLTISVPNGVAQHQLTFSVTRLQPQGK